MFVPALHVPEVAALGHDIVTGHQKNDKSGKREEVPKTSDIYACGIEC